MAYVLEPFNDEFIEKIFSDLSNQPVFKFKRTLPKNWIKAWAIDRDNDSYFYPIVAPGMTDGKWRQFYIHGQTYRLEILSNIDGGKVPFLILPGSPSEIPDDFHERLQSAFDVFGPSGNGQWSEPDGTLQPRTLVRIHTGAKS